MSLIKIKLIYNQIFLHLQTIYIYRSISVKSCQQSYHYFFNSIMRDESYINNYLYFSLVPKSQMTWCQEYAVNLKIKAHYLLFTLFVYLFGSLFTPFICLFIWILMSFDTLNSSPSGQNGRHFADDIFRCIFVNKKFFILIKISLKLVSKWPIDNNPALV